MTHATSASDFDGETGGERIRRAIAAADEQPGPNVIVVGPEGPDDGAWLLERAIELPSHTTLSLRGAHLRLADGANDNLLRNRHFDAGDREVHVVGDGEARLDGNAANQDRRAMAESASMFGIHLYNVDDASLQGFSIGPTENWAIAAENVRDLRVSNLAFAQDGSKPNQDGLHVTGPAERIAVSNVTGTCGDDAVIARSGLGLYGDGGDLRGMTVSNVAIRNVDSCGIFRTVAMSGAVLEDVYATNLALQSDSEAGDAALKIGWNGPEDGHRSVRPGEHRDIVIENVGVNRWDGPFCTIQQPVRDLTIRGVRARHTGPFLWNEEHDVDGLTIEDCASTLTGDPAASLSPFYRELLEGERWIPADQYRGDVLNDPPGAIAFDHATVRDVTVRNVRLRAETADSTEDQPDHPIALRVYDTAAVDGLTLSDLRIADYETGIRIDAGADVAGVSCRDVRHSNVEVPRDVGAASVRIE